MTKHLLLKACFTLSFVLTAMTAVAQTKAALCFSNKTEWSRVRKDLPEVLQNLPLYLATPEQRLKGAISLDTLPASGTFRYDFQGYHSWLGHQMESQAVERICVQGGTIVFYLPGNTVRKMETGVGSSILIEPAVYDENPRLKKIGPNLRYTFVKSNEKEFGQIVSEVQSAAIRDTVEKARANARQLDRGAR